MDERKTRVVGDAYAVQTVARSGSEQLTFDRPRTVGRSDRSTSVIVGCQITSQRSMITPWNQLSAALGYAEIGWAVFPLAP